MTYLEFLASKRPKAVSAGFEKPVERMNPALFDWQKDIVCWALKRGRCALFEDCGLGKTIQQLEWAQSVCDHCGMPVLIVSPLAVAQQTRREGKRFGYDVSVVRGQSEAAAGINVTNYEMLGHFDAERFCGVVLDESSILKNFAGKLRTEIIEKFRDTPYRLSCTATPAPNDYMELGSQAEFCGVMSRTEMLATWFVHDGGETSKWRLKGHARGDFWQWLAGWAAVLQKPSDLGYPDGGYVLPELRTFEHVVSSRQNVVDGNFSIFPAMARTLIQRRDARRDSIKERCRAAAELVMEQPEEQWLIWCDLNAESAALAAAIPGAVEIRGSDSLEDKERAMSGFTDGTVRTLVTKPSIAGWGLNWQNCCNMIFVGLSDSYEMMYQAIRRCWRFGQERPVNVHIIISESEGNVRRNIERKERQAAEMTAGMVRHTKETLENEIRGTERISIPYHPTVEMALPGWLGGEASESA